jgi:transcription antitermination factor NusG
LRTGVWETEPGDLNWFAVHTRTRFEKKVVSELNEKGIETFLPLISEKHKWSDRNQVVHQPLFSGYVFVRIAPIQDTRIGILRTVGVTNFVGVRGLGTPIPDGEIRAIQTLLEQRVPFLLFPFLNIGQRVRIRGGCLDRVEGILTAINGNESLVISVQLIQRSIAIQISGFQVEPVQSVVSLLEPGRTIPRKEAYSKTTGKEIQYLGQRNVRVSHS